MNSLRKFILPFGFVLAAFGQQLNSLNNPFCLGCQNPLNMKPVRSLDNWQSEKVGKIIYEINQNFKQFEQYGGFIDAKIALKNGYVNEVNTVAASENTAAKALEAAEKALSLNQPKVAAETIQQEMLIAENTIYDAAVVVFQSLGDGLALSNDNTRLGLGEASQMLQKFGLEVVNQMHEAVNTIRRAVTVGREPAIQTIYGAREALKIAFTDLYVNSLASHQTATKAILDAQNIPVLDQAADLNADAAAKDPDAYAAIAEINKAAADSVARGNSADKIIRLKKLLVSSVGDFAKIASDETEFLKKVQQLDPLVGEQIFRKEFEQFRRRTQNAVSNVFLSFSTAAHNYDIESRRKLGLSIRSAVYGNVEVTAGKRTAFGLTVVGLRLPKNIGSLVLRAADESSRQGKVAIFRRIIEAARIAFNVL